MRRIATCQCGTVAFEANGKPILAAICHCRSCQTGGRYLQSLAGAPPVLEADLGTRFVLLRKDRVRCLRGGAGVAEHRLTPGSSTRRVVASCCNSPMFLEFTKGHWLSFYMDRFEPPDRPTPELRTMTRDLQVPIADDAGVPAFATHSAGFMWKLLLAWAAMGFRAPKIDYVKESLE